MKKFSTIALLIAVAFPVMASSQAFAQEAVNAAKAGKCTFLPDAPDKHVVVKGDTLWDISAKFLSNPWCWPEVWGMNRDEIRNPHWIYPGDVISLDMVDGQWRLSVARSDIRVSPTVRIDSLQAEAIPSIPPGDLTPYLTQPIITGPDGLPGAAKIIAARDNRVIRGEGDSVYAISIDEKLGTEWVIYRPGKVLRSFDSNETLGWEMRYLGTARVERYGEVSRMLITSAREEILINDLLVYSRVSTKGRPFEPVTIVHDAALIKGRALIDRLIEAEKDAAKEVSH